MSIYVRRIPETYLLVESHRVGKKVVQQHLKNLGSTPPTPEELSRLKEEYKDRIPPKSGNGRRKRKNTPGKRETDG